MPESTPIANEQDQLLLDGICAYEDYMDAHEVACHHLKQGFLKLAMARMRLPAHALTELSYKEHFDASALVTEASHGLTVVSAADAAASTSDDASQSPTSVSGSTLHRRKTKSQPSKKSEEQESESETKESTTTSITPELSTLLWFSSLPPHDLRQAQKQFIHGLQLLVVAATQARQVQKSTSALGKQSNK